MTDKQFTKIAQDALSAMSDKVNRDLRSGEIPHPANKNAIAQFRRKMTNQGKEITSLIDRRRQSGYYDKNPGAAKKDWEDAYYVRFILRLQDDDWEHFFNKG